MLIILLVLSDYRSDKYNTLPFGTQVNNAYRGASLHSTLEKWKLSYKSKLLSQNVTNSDINFNSTSNDIVLLSFGTWDAALRNMKYFAENTTTILKQFFKTISDDPSFSGVKFFVLTAPAWRERADENNKPPFERKNLRNNPQLAATVYWTVEILKSFPNIGLLDYYSISISRCDEMADAHHYIIPAVIENKATMLGPVGITTANLLLEKMCS